MTQADPAVSDMVLDQFHGLCMGCHAALQRDGLDHGPVRACKACQEGDDEP